MHVRWQFNEKSQSDPGNFHGLRSAQSLRATVPADSRGAALHTEALQTCQGEAARHNDAVPLSSAHMLNSQAPKFLQELQVKQLKLPIQVNLIFPTHRFLISVPEPDEAHNPEAFVPPRTDTVVYTVREPRPHVVPCREEHWLPFRRVHRGRFDSWSPEPGPERNKRRTVNNFKTFRGTRLNEVEADTERSVNIKYWASWLSSEFEL